MNGDSPNNPRQEFGPVVGAVIIVGLLIIGGVYFFLMQEQKLNATEDPMAPQGTSTLEQTNL
ncbi:MAG TPA: hypothetical protein VJZ94_03265 [Candidatus Paceibacterota bacterium]|uniref:Uncharacterized protein n=1 Tax=Candidatus Adlerbacteria bacterium RIFCSPLOWO2_01_FULL_51_16 TaxID=1797243 RepID=A0A1F4XF97_9BACT|nr:MAG: hypothetical protein A2943_01090 [Candidatus Adlerbacteria bacterium RIFCSPLOWO2_01_FULL_51_16]HXK31721.1 hypothetical protein [Candidatus Paceibacterota bacterium]